MTDNHTPITIAKIENQLKCSSVDGRIKKIWCTHTIKIYTAIKKIKS